MSIALRVEAEEPCLFAEVRRARSVNGRIEVKIEIFFGRNSVTVIRKIKAHYCIGPKIVVLALSPLQTKQGELNMLYLRLSKKGISAKVICTNRMFGYRSARRFSYWPARVLGFYPIPNSHSHLALL